MDNLEQMKQAAVQNRISEDMLELTGIHDQVEPQDLTDARKKIKPEFYELFDALPDEEKSTIAYVAKFGYHDLAKRLDELQNNSNGNTNRIIGGHNMRSAITTWNTWKILDK